MSDSSLNESQAWLLDQLKETLNPVAGNRRVVEDSMKAACSQPGYGVALSQIALLPSIDAGIRQLAAVLLKQFIDEHWDDEEENDFIVSSQDKSAIRQNLIQGLEIKDSKVFNTIALTLAHVAISDWPKHWPEIIHYLVSCLSDQSNPSKTHASMKCLCYFSEDMNDENVPNFAKILFPVLFLIVMNVNFDPFLRQKSVSIFHSCIASLGIMNNSIYLTETRNFISPILPNWIKFFGLQLSSKLHLNDKNDIIIKIKSLKSLIQIIHNFPSIAESEIPGILGSIWKIFASGNQIFHIFVNENENENELVIDNNNNNNNSNQENDINKQIEENNDNEDDGKENFSTLIIQEFEFMLSLVTHRTFKKTVENSCEALIYFSIVYLQISKEEFENWSENPNKFICDEEEEIINCRTSGSMLIEELIEQFDEKAIIGLITAIEKRIAESYVGRDKQKQNWWKLREACLFAFGNVSAQLIESNSFDENNKKLDIQLFLKNLLENDLNLNDFPFLQFRTLWFFGRFSSIIPSTEINNFLTASVNVLNDNTSNSLIVKVGACKCLAKLFPNLEKNLIKPILPPLYNGLGNYLNISSEESLHAGLELLEIIVRADGETTLLFENSISSIVLKIFCDYYNDPLLGSDASDILEAIADSTGCIKPLVEKSISIFSNVFTNEKENPSLIAAVLELFTMLLNRCPLDTVKFCFDNLFYQVTEILLHSEDNAELQNAADCLASFLRKAKINILNWSDNEDKILKLIFDSTARLLHPSLDSSSSFRVSVLLNQLILHFPSKIESQIFSIIHSIILKMESSTMPSFLASLVLVFARIIHLASQNVHQFIEILLSLPCNNYDNAFSFLLSQWIQNHGLFFDSYHRKVSISALIILLESKDERLNGVLLKTKENKKDDLENESTMLAPSKILSLLSEILIEKQEEEEEIEERENAMEDVHAEEKGYDGFNPKEEMEEEKDILNRMDQIQSLLNSNLSDDDLGDDPDSKDDPINKIDLEAYIKEFLRRFYLQNPAQFDFLCKVLTPQKVEALKSAV